MTDLEKQFENAAYAIPKKQRQYRHSYEHIGDAISERPKNSERGKQWPYVDFRSDNLEVKD